MRIVVGCATRRGYLFLKRLMELLPQMRLVVFSFREEAWEPPFLDDIRKLTCSFGGEFFEVKQMGISSVAEFWESTSIDLMFLVSWRFIIPARVFQRALRGTFVFHDSLLPEYRGFSPTVWAMINGEDHTGATLFHISSDVDTGDIVDQERVTIGKLETISEVMERVTQTYLTILQRNLENLLQGRASRYPQDHSRATYACKRIPEDNRIQWSLSVGRIFNLIRAVTAPYPGAYTTLIGKTMRVWAARDISAEREYVGAIPGRIAEVWPGQGAVVVTGDGTLLLTKVQIDGFAATCAADTLRVGQTFDH